MGDVVLFCSACHRRCKLMFYADKNDNPKCPVGFADPKWSKEWKRFALPYTINRVQENIETLDEIKQSLKNYMETIKANYLNKSTDCPQCKLPGNKIYKDIYHCSSCNTLWYE